MFLLSTRAGGQGITLTAADTCIIYDSGGWVAGSWVAAGVIAEYQPDRGQNLYYLFTI